MDGSTTIWAPVRPSLATKALMASGGKPRRRRAGRVKRRGSSQSAQMPSEISLPILRLLQIVLHEDAEKYQPVIVGETKFPGHRQLQLTQTLIDQEMGSHIKDD